MNSRYRALSRWGGRWGGWGLGVLLVGSGCGVDLLVGSAETSTTEAGTETLTPETSTGTPPAEETAELGDTTTTEPGTTTDEPSTTTELGTTTTDGTSTGVEESTTGEVSCEGLGFGDCNELSYCLWFGEPEAGECALSPCEDPMHDCWELAFEACQKPIICAWVGEPEMGECAPIECVPCEVLDFPQCQEVQTCEWSELEKICVS